MHNILHRAVFNLSELNNSRKFQLTESWNLRIITIKMMDKSKSREKSWEIRSKLSVDLRKSHCAFFWDHVTKVRNIWLVKSMCNIYRPQTKFTKVMFLQVSVILSTGGGGRAWLLRGGMRGCFWGGMHGCSGVCVWMLLGGHAWLLQGACVVAQGGHAWLLQGGHAWLLQGGMRGCSGGDMRGCSGGEGGGCSWGGMCGCFGGGVCVVFSMRYGQWAGGTHPTGMHSCWQCYEIY